MITKAQAQMFRRLYTKTANQDHIEAWAQMNLEHEQASPIIAKIKVLKYDLARSNPEEFTRTQEWGREQVKSLGYVEKQINPSL